MELHLGTMLLQLVHVVMLKKGNRLSKDCAMFPKIKPYKPTEEQLHRNGRNFPPNFLHQSWLDYLYWDVRLEP